ncbi:hypothetical protein GGR58DRAFT_528345 [Xylaria digitata]|nr:hypothetical protein GGR58DRAFT_528345 [Xylaria digitata]
MKEAEGEEGNEEDSLTLVSAAITQEVHGAPEQPGRSSIQGLLSQDRPISLSGGDMEHRILTENAEIAYRCTTSALVDLFTELEDFVSGLRPLELLDTCWEDDPLATPNIVLSTCSIHLGNCSQLNYPVIEKKVEKK